MSLRLDSPSALPPVYLSQLSQFHSDLAATDFWETARETPGLRAVEDALERYLRSQVIEAYHCTRQQAPGFFQSVGMRPTDLASHQAEFLSNHGHLFTAGERQGIQQAWDDYFHRNPMAKTGRNGMVWAVLCREEVLSDCTAPFFELFGGEAVFMPLKHHPTVTAKLREIGQPVVVEFTIPANEFHSFQPLAYQVLSRYHRSVNPRARPYPIEGRVLRPVAPVEVLRVTPRDEFQI